MVSASCDALINRKSSQSAAAKHAANGLWHGMHQTPLIDTSTLLQICLDMIGEMQYFIIVHVQPVISNLSLKKTSFTC